MDDTATKAEAALHFHSCPDCGHSWGCKKDTCYVKLNTRASSLCRKCAKKRVEKAAA